MQRTFALPCTRQMIYRYGLSQRKDRECIRLPGRNLIVVDVVGGKLLATHKHHKEYQEKIKALHI